MAMATAATEEAERWRYHCGSSGVYSSSATAVVDTDELNQAKLHGIKSR